MPKIKVRTKSLKSHISYLNKGIKSLGRWAGWSQADSSSLSRVSGASFPSHRGLLPHSFLQSSSHASACRLWPGSTGGHTQWGAKSVTGQGCHQVREGAILELLVRK